MKLENWERALPDRGTYWVTRFVILRLLGIVYAIAFLVAANQILPLIGSDGLLPLGNFIDQVSRVLGGSLGGFLRLPSLFWLNHSDHALVLTAWLGFALSCVVACGYANALLLALLWILYMSFVHVGQDWYGYGWEVQLLETGFLAIFLCPLLDGRPFPRRPPPLVIIWLFRALIFRIMFGAGMIKIRGDESWRDLTALYYHFETQPIPNGLSSLVSFSPARRFACRDVLQSSRGTGRSVVRLLAASRAKHRRDRDRRLPNHDRARRQPVVSQLAHDHSRARLLR